MRTLVAIALFIAPSLAFATIQPSQSKPVRLGDLDFVVVTASRWYQDRPVLLRLRITNRGENAIIFPTFDTFTPKLTTPDGETKILAGERDATRITPNLLLQPGEGFSYALDAKFKHPFKPNQAGLHYQDHTGSGSFTALNPGTHSIAFDLSPCHFDFEKRGDKLPAPLWAEKGATAVATFTVLGSEKKDPFRHDRTTTEGFLHQSHRSLLRLVAPIQTTKTTIGGLDFSLVTQKTWMLPERKRDTAKAAVRLRIENNGREPLLFPTFDTLLIKLLGPDGKEVWTSAGRKATYQTPDILLAPGTGYSLPLTTDIFFDKVAERFAISIGDGTGTYYSGSALAGKHALTIGVGYEPSARRRAMKLPAPLWSGTGSTKPATFEMRPNPGK